MVASMMAAIDKGLALGHFSQLNRTFVRFLADQDNTASELVLWAGALASYQLDKGEVCLDLAGLAKLPLPAGGYLSLAQWQAALLQSTLVSSGPGNTPMVLDGDKLYLRRYWDYQQILSNGIQQRLPPMLAALPAATVAQLDTLFPGDGSGQPDWQKIACVLALRARFSIITGGPGTGKTTTLTKLLALLIPLMQLASPHKKPVILLAAPTGKAAARVSESIAKALARLDVDGGVQELVPKKASTLHRLLGSSQQSRRYRHHRDNPIVADIVIVDEASMIDLEMMASLLAAMPETCQLILLGDKDQLASVEAGSVLGDLCLGAEQANYDASTRSWLSTYAGVELADTGMQGTLINQQTIMLRNSHRFDEGSGIGQLAKAVNAGDAPRALAILADVGSYPDLVPSVQTDYLSLRQQPGADAANRLLQKMVVVNAGDDEQGQAQRRQGYGYYLAVVQEQRPTVAEAYDAWAKQVLTAFDSFQILCALRRGAWGVEGLNQRVEAWLFPKQKPPVWYEGRPVMISQNDYTLGLMNGDVGIALYDSKGKLRVAFANDEPQAEQKIRWVSPMRLPDVETAYAITVHKSQGSEYSHVALVLPEIQSPVVARELIYTGITRAKENFTLVETGAEVFRRGIKARIKNAQLQGFW